MSFQYHAFEASQAGRPHSTDQGGVVHINGQAEYTSFDGTAVAPHVVRRNSVPADVYGQFSPDSAATPWVEGAYASPHGMSHQNSNASFMVASPATESTSHDSFGALLHHVNPMHWHTIDHNGALHTSLPTTTMSIDTTSLTQVAAPTTGVAYSSAMVSQVPITSPISNSSDAAYMASPRITPQSFSSPSPSIVGLDHMHLAENDVQTIRSAIHRASPNRGVAHGFANSSGVRKKNARQDIPEGRSLKTIDGLIARASELGQDEDVKEMKQQKRLLRNRQAALDSRTRKRTQMSNLEAEKKTWQAETDELNRQLQQMTEENEKLQQTNHNLQLQVQALTRETNIQLEHHNEETMLLRATIERLKIMPHKAVQGDFFAEEYQGFSRGFDGLSISDWDQFTTNTELYPDSDTSLSAISDHPIKKGSNHTRLPSLKEKAPMAEDLSEAVEHLPSHTI